MSANMILDTATGYSLNNLASLSYSKKLQVIAFLTNSLLETSEKNKEKNVLDKICGSWSEEGISAKELIDVCESGRNRNREIIDL